MITISFLGLDQFVVGHYSKDHTANLANLFEADESLINFYAPNSMLFHNGVEQTSWNVLVIVRAPKKYKVLEDKVAEYILKTLTDFAVHVELEFEYFDADSRYENINPNYPRYMAASNIKDEYNYVEDETEEEHHHHHHHDEEEGESSEEVELNPNDPDQIYLGNAFEGFEEKLAEKQAENKKK
ncbi:MAG: hypothetical protein J6328_00530 [Bacilli bacterium]|nr:hypothetical protein [Bacilli bacterium]